MLLENSFGSGLSIISLDFESRFIIKELFWETYEILPVSDVSFSFGWDRFTTELLTLPLGIKFCLTAWNASPVERWPREEWVPFGAFKRLGDSLLTNPVGGKFAL